MDSAEAQEASGVASPAALQVEQYISSRAEVEVNPPIFEQHDDLPEDLQDQLDLLRLRYWPECHAILCKACSSDSRTRPRTTLSRDIVLPHLQRHHGFDVNLQGKVLKKCLGRLRSLAQFEDGLRKPVPGLPPRSFLEAPVNGWKCSMCDFATDDVRANEAHFGGRHHALLSWQKRSPTRVLVQHVDGEYFEVKGDLNVDVDERNGDELEVSNAPKPHDIAKNDTDFPDFLHHWMECHAFICKTCESRPILCRSTIITHLQDQHAEEEALKDLESFEHKLNVVEPLAQEPENIRLPNPWLGVQSFLQPPVAGYACASHSCGWASVTLKDIQEHESAAHNAEIQTSGRAQVMVQYVTLFGRVFFPVARFSDVLQEGPKQKAEIDTAESSDFQDYLQSLKVKQRELNAEADDISIWAPNTGEATGTGRQKTTSLAESDQTHRSIVQGRSDREFMDTYTVKERYDILASLWNAPSAAELKPLSSSETRSKIRTLVMRDKEDAPNVVKRFDAVFRQTLLATQHEIVELEEAMSQGAHVPAEALRKILTEYCKLFHRSCIDHIADVHKASLVKSYKELLAMKQPGQKESRAFGRLFATELHEPRYWYAVDALDLIDLQVEVERGSHDIVRKFLQHKLPVSFLDRVGKERRELDEIEARKELPSGNLPDLWPRNSH